MAFGNDHAALTLSERLNRSAYSCYSSSSIVPVNNRSTATTAKRLFAAALLSSSSLLVLGGSANALPASVCTPIGPSAGATVTCTGSTVVREAFAVDDLTVVTDENFSLDTRARSSGAAQSNSGIHITGDGATIRQSGSIKTGQTVNEGGTYGQHHGLFIAAGAGNAYAENKVGGSISTYDKESAGIFMSGTSGQSLAVNRGTILTGGTKSYGIQVVNPGTATGRNYGTITAQGSYGRGISATSIGGNATATNSSTISITGDRGQGLVVSAGGGVATVTNSGSVTANGTFVRGINASGATTNIDNTGTVSVTGDNSYGVIASSFSEATTNITNSGTITQSGAAAGMVRYGPSAIIASGPTVNITNTSTGTITGTDTAIRVGGTTTGTIRNDGTINGDIVGPARSKRDSAIPTLSITNTGTVNGAVVPGPDFAATVVNNGGTIGDGIYAVHTSKHDDSITISGDGNVINGAFRDDGGTGAGNNAINFNHTDTLVLNGSSRGYAFFGFETANFNSGTTVIAQQRNIGTYSAAGSRVNINAGATLTTSSTALDINTNQLTVSGRGNSRGTLSVPAGSRVEVSNGSATFEQGGRLTVGIASDSSAGYFVSANNLTFQAGSEIFADVTRGIDLTDGNAIKVAGAGGAIADNGVDVFDNTTLFDFTREIRNNGRELYLIVDRVLTAAQATFNKGGRDNARDIADALDDFISNAPTDNPIVTYLAQFPVEEQEQRLFQLVQDTLPSESGATGTSTVVSTDMVLDLIMDRLSSGGFVVVDSGEGETGVSAGEQFLGGAGNWALWGRAGASFAEYTPSGVNGFDSDTYAASLGLDGDVAENLRLGLALFYSDTSVDENGVAANSAQDIEGYGVLLYGTYRPEAFYVNATMGYGLNQYESSRLALGGVNRADYDGTQFMARVETGKVFSDGAWDLYPHVGLRFNYVTIDGYTETGPLPTSVAGQDITSLRGVLGIGARYTHVAESGAKWIPEGYVRGIQELADPNEAVTGNVVGGGTFISQSAGRDKLSYAVGGGLTYEMNDGASIRFLYDGEFQEDYQEHSLSAALRFQF